MWHVWLDRRGAYRISMERPEWDLGVGGRIILKLVFRK